MDKSRCSLFHNEAHTAYKIPLLHLLHFFRANLIFFSTIEQTVAVCFTMNHHTTYIKYLCYTCCAFFSDSSDFFLSLDKSRCSLFHNEPPNCIYIIPLLHLLRFFRATLIFFYHRTKFRCSLFHNEPPYCIYKVPLLHLLHFFFQTPLIFFYHWTNLVAVCFTMKHHTAYKIPLLHLLRFFKPSLDFFLPLNRPLQFVSQ